jgi:hypothetical protein
MAECKECGCQTGGGDYCYQHKPYTVTPLKDGSFRVDRFGVQRVWLDAPPAPLASVLRAIRGWDMLDATADGPYWKGVIDEALGVDGGLREMPEADMPANHQNEPDETAPLQVSEPAGDPAPEQP